MKTEWGVKEREREREQLINGVRDSERQSCGWIWKWRGLEMAASEKGHLSISK